MDGISRRTLLGTILSVSVLGIVLPSRAKAKAADQPHMQAALDALRTAQRELEAATEDKGGHRVKALRLVRQAIDQVDKGIRYDRRH